MVKINLQEKLALISDYWNPRIIEEVNNHYVKLVKFQGEFDWHQHENEDELFLVLEGQFQMQYQDHSEEIHKGELVVVPHGIIHRPVAQNEVHCLLVEPQTTINTGNETTEKTQKKVDRI